MVIYNYTVVGYVSLDELIFNKFKYRIFGGSVVYGSIQASKIWDKTGIISAIGSKDKEDFIKLLRNFNINALKLETYSGDTLSFINEYINGKRYQRVKNKPNLILDLSNLDFKTKCLHLGPILEEIKFIEFHSFAEIVALDIQGLCRKYEEGKILLKDIENLSFINYIDILKCDLNEFKIIGKSINFNISHLFDLGLKILIITLGEKGSILVTKNNSLYIPPFKSKIIKDPTGAGDVFLSSFLISYYKTRNLEYSGIFASCSASFVIEDYGFLSIASLKDIEKRINEQNLKVEKIDIQEISWAGPDLNRGPSPRKGDILPG